MRRCKTLATAVAAMVLLGSSEGVQIPEAEVHDRGLDALHVGMSVTEAEAALGRKLESDGGAENEFDCRYLEPAPPGPIFSVMVVSGTVARIDVGSQWIATRQGVGVASPIEAVKAAYPGAEVRPHKHVDGHYVTVHLATGLRLVFETMDDGEGIELVTSYRIGRMPEVRWVEGCS